MSGPSLCCWVGVPCHEESLTPALGGQRMRASRDWHKLPHSAAYDLLADWAAWHPIPAGHLTAGWGRGMAVFKGRQRGCGGSSPGKVVLAPLNSPAEGQTLAL